MKKKFLLSILTVALVLPLVTSAAGFSDHWFQWLKGDQSAQVVGFKTSIVGESYKRGDKSSVVLEVQKALNEAGLYNGDLSGLLGPKTERAISSYQTNNNLPVTGVLDKATIDSILKSGDVRPTTNPGATVLPPCTRDSDPWIRVTSPNGGEVYQPGQQINVTWTSCNITSSATIGVILNQGDAQTWSEGNPFILEDGAPDSQSLNDGSQIVTIPSSVLNGDYKIWVRHEYDDFTGNAYHDSSNNFFLITDEEGCEVTTEQTDPFISSIPTTNVSPFSDSWTNGYNEMSVFRIQNPTNCPMHLGAISVVSTSTDGIEFAEKADFRLKKLSDGSIYSPTNINPYLLDSNTWFFINETIPANGYKDYGVGVVDLHYSDPYPESAQMSWGGIAVGIGQVDYNNSSNSWNGNTFNPTPTLGPIWGPVQTVLP